MSLKSPKKDFSIPRPEPLTMRGTRYIQKQSCVFFFQGRITFTCSLRERKRGCKINNNTGFNRFPLKEKHFRSHKHSR